MKKIVITGMGVRCGKAENVPQFAKVCLSGSSMICRCTAFPTKGLSTEYFGQAEGLHDNRMKDLLASSLQEMMQDAGISKQDIVDYGNDCRFFAGTLIFTSEYYCKHSQAKLAGKKDAFCADNFLFADWVKHITGIEGSVEVVSSACASGTTSVGMAMDYVRSGACKCAIAGGFDPLSIFTACGFNSLKSLSQNICKPFSVNRDGLNIGEAAAFFFIETEESARARGAEILCEVAGYGLSNDAYHITSPAPDGRGARQAMLSALQDADMMPDDIDYINAHGTGTLVNDAMEYMVMEDIFGNSNKDIWFSSTKSIIGHCMGASGAIELAASIIAMQHNRYLPMPLFDEILTEGMKDSRLRCSSEGRSIHIDAVMSNSFAFSGHNASIIIRRI